MIDVHNTRLGHPVLFNMAHRLYRQYGDVKTDGGWPRHWRPLNRATDEECRGVFIGWRTLSNGLVYYDHTSTTYRAKEHFTVAVVVYDARKNPIYLIPEDVRLGGFAAAMENFRLHMDEVGKRMQELTGEWTDDDPQL